MHYGEGLDQKSRLRHRGPKSSKEGALGLAHSWPRGRKNGPFIVSEAEALSPAPLHLSDSSISLTVKLRDKAARLK